MSHHSILIYGASGCGKTSIIGQLVKRLLKDFPSGCKARLYSAEHYDSVADVIEAGFMDAWKINTRPHPFETVHRAVDGYWLKDANDPAGELIPPAADNWQKYPIRIFEGMATISRYIASNHHEGGLLWRAGRGDIIGPVQEHIQFRDGEDGIGGLCWAHYRIGQMEMEGLAQRSQKHPGYTIWTTHEDEGREKGIPIVGPEVFGSKMTATIGKEFGELWHIAEVPTAYQTEDGLRNISERRIYLKNHYPPGSNVLHKAKNSFGLENQASVPDYITLTTEAGLFRPEGVDKLVALLKKTA